MKNSNAVPSMMILISICVFYLQDVVEECGPKKIVNHCKCPPNHLRWTKCLIKKLQLKKPDCPREKQCISLQYLSNMFKCYKNRGRMNCHE